MNNGEFIKIYLIYFLSAELSVCTPIKCKIPFTIFHQGYKCKGGKPSGILYYPFSANIEGLHYIDQMFAEWVITNLRGKFYGSAERSYSSCYISRSTTCFFQKMLSF